MLSNLTKKKHLCVIFTFCMVVLLNSLSLIWAHFLHHKIMKCLLKQKHSWTMMVQNIYYSLQLKDWSFFCAFSFYVPKLVFFFINYSHQCRWENANLNLIYYELPHFSILCIWRSRFRQNHSALKINKKKGSRIVCLKN